MMRGESADNTITWAKVWLLILYSKLQLLIFLYLAAKTKYSLASTWPSGISVAFRTARFLHPDVIIRGKYIASLKQHSKKRNMNPKDVKAMWEYL